MVSKGARAAGGAAASLCIVSASGGVGKSAISLMAAYLASRAGIKTALLEADLQFGDIGFWLGLDGALSTVAEGLQAQPLEIGPSLDLFKAPCFPELAEEVSEDVARLASRIRAEYDLVIADTGAFWSGLTADLAVEASAVVLVNDQRPASIAGNVRALELCARMGIPAARAVHIYNKWSSKARISSKEAQEAFGASRVLCVPDGKGIVDEMLCAGDMEELFAMENTFAGGVDNALTTLLPRVGCLYGGAKAHVGRWAT